MTLNDKKNDEEWDLGAKQNLATPVDAAAKPGSVPSINGEAISVKLTRLGNQRFLAHLIGIAVLEAEQFEQD